MIVCQLTSTCWPCTMNCCCLVSSGANRCEALCRSLYTCPRTSAGTAAVSEVGMAASVLGGAVSEVGGAASDLGGAASEVGGAASEVGGVVALCPCAPA